MISDDQSVEVVMRKEMPMSEYKRIYQQSIKKGWKIQAYQLGRFSEPMNKKVEHEL